MIQGVFICPLKQLPDERGKIMHMLRNDDPWSEKFGEIYFSTVYPSVIKGRYLHEIMTLNYAVVKGMIKLVRYDDRNGSPTKEEVQEIFTADDSYCLITVPPNVWNAFSGLGVDPSIVANCSTELHDPAEIVRLDPTSGKIPSDWDVKHG